MGKTFIFGHKNPDTDTICSAIVYADLKTKLGFDVEAVRLGDVNGETEFALKTFQAEAPRLIEKAAPEVETVILVDHNERQQSVDDIDDVRVLEVIDHHRIANFETTDPLYYRAEPVGCTTTILNKLYKEHGVAIEKNIAGLMLSAIISDSLLFKSPTCTEEDRKAAKELAEIADVDVDQYGLDMLKAGADLSGKTAAELIGIDAKVFPMGSKKVEIAQINAIDPADVLALKAGLEEAVTEAIVEKTLDLFLVVITDILNSDSVAIAIGAETSAVEEAFQVKLENNQALLKGVVSRKKQIVPVLTEILQER
ncbi:manganese-dependent inorganic pyrophosphatase [Domibacillus enclensis]|uniref:Probable manganese-dependent inorganic pyrophosphatase n=1 Tax=Domibacillus enclensis TaxID=1017273 RepID=A0A1N7BSQ9_9BACI|nr:manganese-dependent inorganic pyrophosphatase [Domibacillus enclensis]OXS74533.1 manganese-dependent inorganic pyrophosphatase [Domibacillus enclensis]SIR54273.1 manganese-dependent inorganic pyrophosphatase [Domibacillus enclensis]